MTRRANSAQGSSLSGEYRLILLPSLSRKRLRTVRLSEVIFAIECDRFPSTFFQRLIAHRRFVQQTPVKNMDISTVRPKVAQLTFQLLSRSVHPELFHIYKSQTIERDKYSARIDITSDGHVIRWTSGKSTFSEIASSTLQPVPQGRHIFSMPLLNQHRDSIELMDGIRYKYDYELQRVPAEMFRMIQQQLRDTAETHELFHLFNSSGRIAIGGLSFVHVEARIASLHVRAIHTFPDDLALVKTESTFSVVD